jgi:hypothetical protein
LRHMTRVETPQNAGSSCVRNWATSGKKAPQPPDAKADAKSARAGAPRMSRHGAGSGRPWKRP